jgi:hypothetical protein
VYFADNRSASEWMAGQSQPISRRIPDWMSSLIVLYVDSSGPAVKLVPENREPNRIQELKPTERCQG